MRPIPETAQPLIDSIQTGNRTRLRQVLNSGQVIDDDDFDFALYYATARRCLASCRILCEFLSPTLQEKYSAEESDSPDILLHEAVRKGFIEIARLFKEYNFNLSQRHRGTAYTPLDCALHDYVTGTSSLEITRYLLENGADPNKGGPVLFPNFEFVDFGPLSTAVRFGNINGVRLLLEHGADPNLNRSPDDLFEISRNVDIAIRSGRAEMLSMLLQHGAFIGHSNPGDRKRTSVNSLLCLRNYSRETKLSICRILVEHAKKNSDTAACMQTSLEREIDQATQEDVRNAEVEDDHRNYGCEILLEAGMEPSSHVMYYAVHQGKISVCQLLVRYGGDPFLREPDDCADETDNPAESPLVAAARKDDTGILDYFLDRWDEHFSSRGGRNNDGDLPIHVLCCDAQVSLPSIELAVERQAESLATVDGEQDLLPFHFAAMWEASLDVIFYLLQHFPDALRHCDKPQAAAAASPSSSEDVTASSAAASAKLQGKDWGPVKKKAKTCL